MTTVDYDRELLRRPDPHLTAVQRLLQDAAKKCGQRQRDDGLCWDRPRAR